MAFGVFYVTDPARKLALVTQQPRVQLRSRGVNPLAGLSREELQRRLWTGTQ